VWGGGLVSLTGDWVLMAALPLVVYQMTGSTLALGLTLGASMVPRLVVGSVAGVYVDRWDRRRTMLVADVLMGLSLLPLLLVNSSERLWLLGLTVFVQSSIVQFYRPAEGALLPRLVPEADLVAANALNGLNMNLARLAGPPLGALLVQASGLAGVVVVDAGSFFVAALTVSLVRVHAPPETSATCQRSKSALGEWLAALRLLRAQPTPQTLLIFLAITAIGEGIMSTLFVPFTTRVLHGDEFTYGALLSAQAVGGLLGSLAVGRFGPRIHPVFLVGGGALGLGFIDLLIFYAPLVTPVAFVPLLLMALVGAPAVAVFSGFLTLVQTSVSDEYRGRVLGLAFATTALSGLVGMVLAGVLAEPFGIIPLLTVQGVGYLTAGSLVLGHLSRAK
jgi:MFS family permease